MFRKRVGPVIERISLAVVMVADTAADLRIISNVPVLRDPETLSIPRSDVQPADGDLGGWGKEEGSEGRPAAAPRKKEGGSFGPVHNGANGFLAVSTKQWGSRGGGWVHGCVW